MIMADALGLDFLVFYFGSPKIINPKIIDCVRQQRLQPGRRGVSNWVTFREIEWPYPVIKEVVDVAADFLFFGRPWFFIALGGMSACKQIQIFVSKL